MNKLAKSFKEDELGIRDSNPKSSKIKLNFIL